MGVGGERLHTCMFSHFTSRDQTSYSCKIRVVSGQLEQEKKSQLKVDVLLVSFLVGVVFLFLPTDKTRVEGEGR